MINKDKKVEYIGKVLELMNVSYGEIGSIYKTDSIDTFNAVAVDKKYKRVIHILEIMRTVVESGEFDQFNEAQIRVYFKNQNMFTLEVDPNLFQDFNLVNYYGIPTFDFMNIINTYIYNESVVKIDSYAEYINSEEGRAQIKAAMEAQENARKQQSMANSLSNMSPDDIRKFMEMLGTGNIANSDRAIPNNTSVNRFGPAPQNVDNAEVVGQNLIPTNVKPVGSWK